MINNEFDVNTFASNIVVESAKGAIGQLKSTGKSKIKKIQVKYNKTFEKYIKQTYDRLSKIKTLLYRDKPVDLKLHYIDTSLKLGNKLYSDKSFHSLLKKPERLVVIGTAGSGKSIFLRKLYLDFIENPINKIPIYIEIKNLDTEDLNLKSHIHTIFSDINSEITSEQIEYGLSIGRFILFLDGYDEIDPAKHEILQKEIIGIANKYAEIPIIVTSRPDDCFDSWEVFKSYTVMPLNKKKAISLISKIEYETNVKEKFMAELNNGLYEKHEDFLSIPLLLTMMLLTYEQLAEIPKKIHLFYEQAFETLFQKHDAIKSLFKRKTFTGLAIDDFKKIFSTFCMLSYTENKYSFSNTEVLTYIQTAIEIDDFSVDKNAFLKDLLKSVCILQKDGINFTFTHRSFQEYFSALFISTSQSIDIQKVMDKICVSNWLQDNVTLMLFDMNTELLEKQWIMPNIMNLLKKIESIDYIKFPADMLEIFYSGIGIEHGAQISFRLDRKIIYGYFNSSLNSLYSKYRKSISSKIDQKKERETLFNSIANKVPIKYGFIEIKYVKKINDELINQSTIVQWCKSRQDFFKNIYKDISERYAKKELSLKQLIFGDS